MSEQPDGVYLTPDQTAFSERIAQSGLFAIAPNGQLRWTRDSQAPAAWDYAISRGNYG
jgi:hypothetical protein